jgi:hypothetical protein
MGTEQAQKTRAPVATMRRAQRKNAIWRTITQVGRSQHTRKSGARGVPTELGTDTLRIRTSAIWRCGNTQKRISSARWLPELLRPETTPGT